MNSTEKKLTAIKDMDVRKFRIIKNVIWEMNGHTLNVINKVDYERFQYFQEEALNIYQNEESLPFQLKLKLIRHCETEKLAFLKKFVVELPYDKLANLLEMDIKYLEIIKDFDMEKIRDMPEEFIVETYQEFF